VGHSLQPTALVHEAYLRLVDQQRVRWRNRAHFYAVAAGMMRRPPALAGSLQKAERGYTWQRWRQAIAISTSWVSWPGATPAL